MSKPRVFITRRLLEPGLGMILEHCDAEIWSEPVPPSREEIMKRILNIDGLLCLLTDQIDADMVESAGRNLKVISNCGVGVDHIDLRAATSFGIPVGNTPGVLTDAVADFTFALLLAVARRICEGERWVHSGAWKTWALDVLLGSDISGATLGIVGYGRIGRAVARRAQGFNMNIIFNEPIPIQLDADERVSQVGLKTLLRESDFISLHCPLTIDTHSLMNSSTLSQMKPTAILINTSRGPVVDQDALFTALTTGGIAAAALDVTIPEPLPSNHPLLSLDNCLVTPHIASASHRTRSAMSQMAAENLLAGVRDEILPYCVNPEVYKEK